MVREVYAKCEEGICPVCGSENLGYGERDNGTYRWECASCGATGYEGFNEVFDGHHYYVEDCDGNEVKIYPPQEEAPAATTEHEKRKLYEIFKLHWMIDHGKTLEDLIDQLQLMIDEDLDGMDVPTALHCLFRDWEFGFGFDSEIWPSYEEFCQCEYAECENE